MTTFIKTSLLLLFFALCAAAALVTHRVREATPSPAPQTLFSVVNEQLAAFRAADFRSAYRHAANGVQQKFSLADFEKMVRRDYAQLTEATRVEFGLVEAEGAAAFVQVFFISADGLVQPFVYSFVAEEDGWKIAGVRPLPPARARELHI